MKRTAIAMVGVLALAACGTAPHSLRDGGAGAVTPAASLGAERAISAAGPIVIYRAAPVGAGASVAGETAGAGTAQPVRGVTVSHIGPSAPAQDQSLAARVRQGPGGGVAPSAGVGVTGANTAAARAARQVARGDAERRRVAAQTLLTTAPELVKARDPVGLGEARRRLTLEGAQARQAAVLEDARIAARQDLRARPSLTTTVADNTARLRQQLQAGGKPVFPRIGRSRITTNIPTYRGSN